ncbi:MAG: hypothetical protein B2I17_05685 [Thermoplasmatales archaeon B_DKE]|nr:MAG: hypothetical protein B2I17_05685 [Thermoplasmatales archaeon B_DKE]QRF75177.1 hypothetical protein Thermo_00671 [Thermoplasmatales archaeon]
MAYPVFLEPFSQEITVLLLFVDGLFFGLAIKKAFTSVVLLIVAFMVAYFIGFSLIPKISISNLVSQVSSYASTVHFGSIVISFSIIMFFIGFAIGLWKG